MGTRNCVSQAYGCGSVAQLYYKKSEGPVLAGPSAIFAVLAAALERTHISSAGAGRRPGHWRLLECLGVKA